MLSRPQVYELLDLPMSVFYYCAHTLYRPIHTPSQTLISANKTLYTEEMFNRHTNLYCCNSSFLQY